MRRRMKLMSGMIAVIGTMFFGSSMLKADIDAWPLLEVDKDSTTVCYPFYTHDGDFTMILNLYAKTNHGKDTHIFWPFVKFSDGRLVRVVPFWFSENADEFFLFPLIRETKDYTFWSIPPVYASKDGSYTAVYPFYVKTDSSLFVFPDVYMEEYSSRKSTYVFPFYKYSYDKNSDNHFEFRFMNYIREVNGSNKDYTAFFPFYEHTLRNDGRRESMMLFPYLYKYDERRELTRHTVLPFYSTQKSKSEDYTWCLNYYSKKTKRSDELKFYPFFGIEHEKMYGGRKKEDFWVMWPFYSKETVTDKTGEVVSSKKRFLIFSNDKEEDGTRTFSILGFVIREKVN